MTRLTSCPTNVKAPNFLNFPTLDSNGGTAPNRRCNALVRYTGQYISIPVNIGSFGGFFHFLAVLRSFKDEVRYSRNVSFSSATLHCIIAVVAQEKASWAPWNSSAACTANGASFPRLFASKPFVGQTSSRADHYRHIITTEPSGQSAQ